MNLVLLVLFALYVNVENRPSTTESEIDSEKSFEKKLEEGYQLLKDERDANVTRTLIEKLNNMQEKIKEELTLTPKENAELSVMMKDYIEVERDHIQPMGDNVEEVNRNSKVDIALYQGDMLLTEEQAKEILEDSEDDETARTKRQAYRDKKYPDTIWKNGVVNYKFDDSATKHMRRLFKKAIEIWQNDTCLKFFKRKSAKDRIRVFKGIGCFSSVGRIGGEQNISLGLGCNSVGQVAHEIGHALGFHHTQSRHDRRNFIKVLMKNIREEMIPEFKREPKSQNYNYNLTYDYGSVMHYGATLSSKNNKPVMIPNDVKYSQTLGSGIVSFYDKLMMNLHYGCHERCNETNSANCHNGGFPNPNDCTKCVCPSGYGGRLCNERPNGCGQILNATTSFQLLTDTLGEKDVYFAQYDLVTCNYWITAPPGSTIEVVFDRFPEKFATDGCVFAGVEIKTGSDKRHTGYRFCSPKYANTSLISNENIVPVITYTRYGEVTTVLRYRINSV